MPGVTYFKPAGIPMRMLDEICLSVEEAEAIRLKDLEDLDQEQCAERMNISRPTFQRVLGSARKKVADVLLNGKAIRIEGGNFEMATIHYRCQDGHEWDVPLERAQAEAPQPCLICGETAVTIVQPAAVWRGRGGQGRWHGGGCNR